MRKPMLSSSAEFDEQQHQRDFDQYANDGGEVTLANQYVMRCFVCGSDTV